MRTKNLQLVAVLMVVVMLFTACGSGSKLKSSADLLEKYKAGKSVVGMTIDVEVQSFGQNTSAKNSKIGILSVEWVGMTDQISYFADNPEALKAGAKKVTLKITEVRVANDVGLATQLQVHGNIV